MQQLGFLWHYLLALYVERDSTKWVCSYPVQVDHLLKVRQKIENLTKLRRIGDKTMERRREIALRAATRKLWDIRSLSVCGEQTSDCWFLFSSQKKVGVSCLLFCVFLFCQC